MDRGVGTALGPTDDHADAVRLRNSLTEPRRARRPSRRRDTTGAERGGNGRDLRSLRGAKRRARRAARLSAFEYGKKEKIPPPPLSITTRVAVGTFSPFTEDEARKVVEKREVTDQIRLLVRRARPRRRPSRSRSSRRSRSRRDWQGHRSAAGSRTVRTTRDHGPACSMRRRSSPRRAARPKIVRAIAGSQSPRLLASRPRRLSLALVASASIHRASHGASLANGRPRRQSISPPRASKSAARCDEQLRHNPLRVKEAADTVDEQVAGRVRTELSAEASEILRRRRRPEMKHQLRRKGGASLFARKDCVEGGDDEIWLLTRLILERRVDRPAPATRCSVRGRSPVELAVVSAGAGDDQPFANPVELAQEALEQVFANCWAADHFVPGPSVWSPLGSVSTSPSSGSAKARLACTGPRPAGPSSASQTSRLA